MNSLKKCIKSPLFLRFLSPLLLGVLFCLIRNTLVYLGYINPMPVETLNPSMFVFVTILCIFSYITLMLYPAFWLSDRISKASNLFILIPCISLPLLFNLFVHLVILNDSLQDMSWTKSWSAYGLSAVVSGWGMLSWILSRRAVVPAVP